MNEDFISILGGFLLFFSSIFFCFLGFIQLAILLGIWSIFLILTSFSLVRKEVF